jgi:hypothetical protein
MKERYYIVKTVYLLTVPFCLEGRSKLVLIDGAGDVEVRITCRVVSRWYAKMGAIKAIQRHTADLLRRLAAMNRGVDAP